jgi:NADPH:quinone reductase-like Zn-dependent oxidoreductase
MKSIICQEWSKPTFVSDTPNPPSPPSGYVQIKLICSNLSRVVRSRASGSHYSTDSSGLPHIPGIDGVGRLVDNDQLVYFILMNDDWDMPDPNDGGSFQEILNVKKENIFELPDVLTQSTSFDPVKLSAFINPLFSSWMAMTNRCYPPLPRKESDQGPVVLILGATSASGRLAIGLARYLGATKVIGVGRDLEKLKSLPLDEYFSFKSDEIEKFKIPSATLGKVDVILDYSE